MKNQKGITLIALVITIIVLLILAGVSISMVIGNNGILNQASRADENTRYASEEEQVELAYLSAKTENLGGSVTKEDLNEALEKNQVDATADEHETEEGTIIVTFENGNEYTVKGELVERVEKTETGTTGVTLASQITPSNYGDEINYSDGSGNEWQIFYEDSSENVFLISKVCVDPALLDSQAIGFTLGDSSIVNSVVRNGERDKLKL